MVTVKVFAAGDHYHHDNEEAEDLITFLLEKSGYTKDLVWEARIDKMRTCSNTSPPVRLVSYKPYAVVMRIKTSPDSNTDQIVTLQIPDGTNYKAQNLFEQLQGKAKTINRHWRKEIREKKLAAAATSQQTMHIPAVIKEREQVKEQPQPAPVHDSNGYNSRIPVTLLQPPEEIKPVKKAEPEIIERPAFPNLQGIPDNLKKLKYVLSKIHALSRDEHEGKAEYLDHLVKECEWDKEGHLLRMCSRVLTMICEAGYAMPHVNGRNKVLTYNLTDEGCAVLGIKPDAKPVAPVPKATTPTPPPLDITKLLIESREKVQDLADAGRALDANSVRRKALEEEIAKLQAQIQEIDREDNEIKKVITPEAYVILAKLTAHVNVLPGRTTAK